MVLRNSWFIKIKDLFFECTRSLKNRVLEKIWSIKNVYPIFSTLLPPFIVYGFSILKWVYFEISLIRISFSGTCSSLTRLFQKYQTFLIYFDPPLFMISLLFHLFCTIHGFSLTWTGYCSWKHINSPIPTQFSVRF